MGYMNTFFRIKSAIAVAVMLSAGTAMAGTPLQDSVPVLNSRPGAAYTVYLDPSGFAYDGVWIGETPGTNLGFRDAAPTDTFTAGEQDAIRAMWAAMANQYRSFDVNVTTVDPAVAAGQNASDTQRKNYYDSQARMMHTVIGPPGNAGWQGTADGLAGLGVIDSVAPVGSGVHTNWMFSQDTNSGNNLADGDYIGHICSHECGHTFGLQHQGDFSGGVQQAEYGKGDTAAGPGSYVPTMGDASGKQRVAWRVGTAHNDNNVAFQQNDVAVIAGNNGMGFVDSGIGHSFATATDLPVLTGGAVDVNDASHRGIISPVDQGGGTFNPIGTANYTTDFFAFAADGTTAVSLTLNDGNDFLTPGTADNGATLRSMLSIYDATFALIGMGIEDASTLARTFTDTLAAGSYYAQITSAGGHLENSIFDAASYYEMGGYFLTGSGFVVIPEPATGGFIVVAFGFAVVRRRRAS